jgi:hypothetical protein
MFFPGVGAWVGPSHPAFHRPRDRRSNLGLLVVERVAVEQQRIDPLAYKSRPD